MTTQIHSFFAVAACISFTWASGAADAASSLSADEMGLGPRELTNFLACLKTLTP